MAAHPANVHIKKWQLTQPMCISRNDSSPSQCAYQEMAAHPANVHITKENKWQLHRLLHPSIGTEL
jgi:hypothetical protein